MDGMLNLVAVPVRTHANYQVTKFLPYFIKKYVLFRRNAKLAPLYQFDTPSPGVAVSDGDGYRKDEEKKA
jgi:hypothetical protein